MLNSEPYVYNYFDNSLMDRLEEAAKPRLFMRKKQRMAALEAIAEIQILRKRIYLMATEINEWRWKVGGAAYEMQGVAFLSMVQRGIQNIAGEPVKITDQDFEVH